MNVASVKIKQLINNMIVIVIIGKVCRCAYADNTIFHDLERKRETKLDCGKN